MSGADEMMAALYEAFSFLTEAFGFERTDSHSGQRERHVRYISATTRVTVHLDHLRHDRLSMRDFAAEVAALECGALVHVRDA